MQHLLIALAGVLLVYVVPVAVLWTYVLSHLASALP